MPPLAPPPPSLFIPLIPLFSYFSESWPHASQYILTQPGSNPAYYPVMFRDSTGMFKFIASFTAGVSILIWFAIVYYLRFKGLIHILPLPKGWDDRVKAREWARECVLGVVLFCFVRCLMLCCRAFAGGRTRCCRPLSRTARTARRPSERPVVDGRTSRADFAFVCVVPSGREPVCHLSYPLHMYHDILIWDVV